MDEPRSRRNRRLLLILNSLTSILSFFLLRVLASLRVNFDPRLMQKAHRSWLPKQVVEGLLPGRPSQVHTPR
ncbi:MAG: hypothetical protein DMG05_28525 [Acidobacteria bacterium]|nr:MAG: hypothetical protein DMG05_28525 [Acidobacteriota bacterium]